MGSVKQSNTPPISLSDIRKSVQKRLDALGDGSSYTPEELREIFNDLIAYHDNLAKRETSMQGALVDLVDDMSQTSQTLTETGTRLETILEAAEDVAFIIAKPDDNGEILEFSAGAELIFGYTREDILGLDVNMLCPKQNEGQETEAFTCTVGELASSRMMMQRKSGELFPALYSAYPLKDRNGQATATLMIVLDNSMREMADQLIRESNERYMALAMSTPVSIINFDTEGIITFVNEWHMHILDQGRLQHEFYIGRKIDELPSILRSGVGDKIMQVLEGKPVSLEDVYVPAFGGRDEAWHNIRLSPLVMDGEFKGGILIREDVTRRKRTELDLKLLIDSSPIPLLKVELTEMGKIIRSLNPEAVAMFGKSALNKPLDAYIADIEGDDPELAAMHGQHCEVQTKDGPRQAIRTSHQPSGQFEVQAVMDVGVLIEAKAQAEDASRAKSDFIANISHEIRTPLNVLLGMLQLFQEEDMGEEMNEMADHATGAAKSLLALLNDILDFSVVESRALALDENDFSLTEIIELVAVPYMVEAASKGIELTYDIAPDIPSRLWGDGRRLRQCIFHVTGNAVKFTDSGTVHLETAWRPHAGSPTCGMLEISVSDTGIGMTKEQENLIFEPFRQGDGSRKRRHGGTGIGLALVHEFVTAMGGTITVDSEPGKGTVFSFTVDVAIPNSDPAGT